MGGRRLDRTPRKISHPLDQFSKNGFSPTSLFPNANDTFLAVELSTFENRWGVVSYEFSTRYLGVRRVTRHGWARVFPFLLLPYSSIYLYHTQGALWLFSFIGVCFVSSWRG